MRSMVRYTIGLALLLALAAPLPLAAAPTGGVAMLLGIHLVPIGDDLAVPRLRAPGELRTEAPLPGDYDAWVVFFSKRPLVGAWTMSIGLDFDTAPGSGIDVLSWEGLADRALPEPGWPDAGPGAGIRIEWDRYRCQDPGQWLLRGTDGWFLQPALRLRLRIHGPDRLRLADPEPGVRAQVVQCGDEEFRLDGVDGWTAFIGAGYGGLP
jgi:hypothetical protein